MNPLRPASVGALLLAAVTSAPAAQVQDFPVRPVRIVVGPGSDVIARLVGSKLTGMWGQQIVVDPRPGAGGAIALETTARGGRDGYTCLLSTAVYTINAAMYPNAPFDIVRDFAPVTNLASAGFFLLVHPSVPAKSIGELIELARAKPGQLNYSSAGVATPPHLAAEMFKSMARVNIVHVPYKSAAASLTDLIGGQVQVSFQFAPTGLPMMKAGKARALAVSTLKRTAFAPELPTLAESGLAGYEVIGWNGIHVPRGTPEGRIAKINADLREVLRLPDVQEKLLAGMLDLADSPPQAFGAFVRKDVARFAKVIREAGIQPE